MDLIEDLRASLDDALTSSKKNADLIDAFNKEKEVQKQPIIILNIKIIMLLSFFKRTCCKKRQSFRINSTTA